MSKFKVAGRLDGASYEVEVTKGGVAGSRRVAALVEQYHGENVLVTPLGPVFKVDRSDPASLLALLSSHTQVRSVEGDAPVLVEEPPAGANH